jgi:PadR family transcriptional regulator PadR
VRLSYTPGTQRVAERRRRPKENMQHTAIARPRPLIVAHLLLLLAEQPRHGYELAESLRTSEFEGITTSTVYRELAKLQENGLVQSFWQSSQARGPARHMYELTECGRADLAGCADDVRRLMTHLDDFLDRFASVDGVAPPALPEEEKGRRRFWRSR